MLKKLIVAIGCFLLPINSTNAQQAQPFPAICMPTEKFSNDFIDKNKMMAIIISYDSKNDILYMVTGNAKRMVIVTISSLKDNNTCILSAFEDAEGIVDFDKFKPREKS